MVKLVTNILVIQAMNAGTEEDTQAEMTTLGNLLPEVIVSQQSAEEEEKEAEAKAEPPEMEE